MAEFTIKTFDEKIHNIYIKGDVDEDMWSNLVDKINEIKSEDDDIADQNLASLMSVGIEAQIIRPAINIYLCTYGGILHDMFAIYDEIKKLSKEYEVIVEDISEDEDCFIFDTEREANECLKLIFNNGCWIDDIQYGKVRYYVEQVTY